MNIKVWVSYAREEHDHLERLKREVGLAGKSLPLDWLTDEGIQAGDCIPQWIADRIIGADLWILLLSPAFRNSDWCCIKELSLIQQRALLTPKRRRLWLLLLHKYEPRDELDVLTDLERMGISVLARDWPIIEAGEGTDDRWRSAAMKTADYLRGLAIEKRLVPPSRLEDLRSEILRGKLTPFLGPSCCDIQENYEPALPHLRCRLTQLLSVLQGRGDKGARDFAIAIAASRRLKLNGKVKGDWTAGNLPSGFLKMQAAIARLGAAGCAVFGDALGRRYQGLTDTRTYSIGLDGVDAGLVRGLARALIWAAEAAKAVPADDACLKAALGSRRPCAGTSGIWTKLVKLTSLLFGGDQSEQASTRAALEEWCKLFEERLRRRNLPMASGRMALNQLEWLGDLLWHTMRFDAPLFPSPDDLSFQFSLCHDAPHCIARMSLGMAASLHDDADCFRLIVTHFEEMVATNRENRARDASLSGGLAAMLQLACESRDRNEQRQSKSKRVPKGGALATLAHHVRREEQGPQPMILSSNMDRDIERWLRKDGTSYYLLFPINYRKGRRPPFQGGGVEESQQIPQAGPLQPGWMLKAASKGRHPEYFYVDARAGFNRVVEEVLVDDSPAKHHGRMSTRLPGPLIVYLRGAPLEELSIRPGKVRQILCQKGAEYKLPGSTEFFLRYLLSFLDFSRELAGFQSLPECVRELMTDEDRVLCFLGHPLDEPESLFGIQTDVWLKRTPKLDNTGLGPIDGSQDKRVIIGFDFFDDIRSKMLARMGVIPLRIALDAVAEELAKMFKEEDDAR
ncbi:MAG: toll/interleukin-1 receptor domain-containing protein [Acidobacteria bacterium]|nr:toll/interleukin-1 receptor domain-containing protein [Acidobacteriota bacterium]